MQCLGLHPTICLKTTETLLGIETIDTVATVSGANLASQNYWNPFRDWNKYLQAKTLSVAIASQNYWNPFRDWNRWYWQNKFKERVSKLLKPF